MADFAFEEMDVASAQVIADTWKYDPPYDFYDMTADPEDYAEFVNPKVWPALFFTVSLEESLCGFLTLEPGGVSTEIGLGLRPDLAGKGLGVPFVLTCLNFARDVCGVEGPITLNVAAFNRRAIKVYERIGFEMVGEFLQETNGGMFDFVEMRLNERDRLTLS